MKLLVLYYKRTKLRKTIVNDVAAAFHIYSCCKKLQKKGLSELTYVIKIYHQLFSIEKN